MDVTEIFNQLETEKRTRMFKARTAGYLSPRH